MKLRLLDIVRCASCRGRLELREPQVERVVRDGSAPLPACSGLCGAPPAFPSDGCAACASLEVVNGQLACVRCGATYPVRDGIPHLIHEQNQRDAETAKTAENFGHLWSLSDVHDALGSPYHFEKMLSALALEEPRGLIMDAGCGDGIDLLRHARRTGVEVVGVELSDGGCRTSEARIRSFANAHVVQADLRRVPFDDDTFQCVYSYGVLHHVASPTAAAGELARVVRAGGGVAIYLYEDFGERAIGWRLALAVANSVRTVTTSMPPRLLFVLCQIASPVVYLLFTVPHLLFRSVPVVGGLVRSLPFRHAKTPFNLTGDLYDRFSAPLEHRYNRRTAAELLERSGLSVSKVTYERGWMVLATRHLEGPHSRKMSQAFQTTLQDVPPHEAGQNKAAISEAELLPASLARGSEAEPR